MVYRHRAEAPAATQPQSAGDVKSSPVSRICVSQTAWQQPAVIVALGRLAAQTLLDTEASIGSLRSKVHEYAGVPLVVSYHLVYLLRTLPAQGQGLAGFAALPEAMQPAG